MTIIRIGLDTFKRVSQSRRIDENEKPLRPGGAACPYRQSAGAGTEAPGAAAKATRSASIAS